MANPEVPIMWVYPSGEQRHSLRRYQGKRKCQFSHGYCNAEVVLGKIVETPVPHEDCRWPTVCQCGYEFVEEDEWQDNYHNVYRNQSGTWEGTLSDLPPGAVYDASWFPSGYKVNGQYLIAVCPDGWRWEIDSRASNCTMKEDQVHRCWIRHGRPEDGTLHVDKEGFTCAAGAGSILTGNTPPWHGFLHHGLFVTC
jgi:hypothetical protein